MIRVFGVFLLFFNVCVCHLLFLLIRRYHRHSTPVVGSKKVKFSHTRYRALGPELIPVYRQSARRLREVNHAIYPAVVCHCFLSGLRLPSYSHQMALPVNGSTHLIPAYYSFYRPRKDERLSWPSWLTYSGWFTHNSGHASAAGRAQDKESSPAKDRRSTTVPRHQLSTVNPVLK